MLVRRGVRHNAEIEGIMHGCQLDYCLYCDPVPVVTYQGCRLEGGRQVIPTLY